MCLPGRRDWDLYVRIIVDGISSEKLSLDEQYQFSYLDPIIDRIISPPIAGGTLQVVGQSFSVRAKEQTTLLIKDLSNDCKIPCTGLIILSSTELQCDYYETGFADTCVNKSLVVQTKFGNEIPESGIEIPVLAARIYWFCRN